jgi:hypothetical protein
MMGKKTYHIFGLVNNKGGVSPLCADRPKALDLSRATWTFEWAAVTCPKCLARKPEGALWAGDEPVGMGSEAAS